MVMGQMAPKRVLVTGGAGFLGSNLCERLLDKGCEVVCLDNFFTGSLDNVEHLVSNPRFTVIKHDVIDPINMEVDEIYNLACPASPIHYQHDPIFTTKTSVLGALNLLELARKNGAKILQASTSEVYGDPNMHPQREEYWGHVNPVGIRSCYDEGKRCAESLYFDYNRMYGVPIKVVRIFNTYGPNMHPEDGRVVSNFIMQALNGEPLTIYGDGSQTRSFCFVDDLIDGFIAFMELDNAVTGPINLGNPIERSMTQLATLIKEITGSGSEIVFKELPSDDPKQRRPDISLAKREFNWEPVVDLEQGLKKTVFYFKERAAAEMNLTKVLRAS
jgi:UDP-glucuronate decarboxylase